jgi:acyl dehydratase
MLSLSLVPVLIRQVYGIDGIGTTLNYGFNKVRFPTPVPVGSRIRARAAIASVDVRADHAIVTLDVVVEIEGLDKPACVAQYLRYCRAEVGR